MSLFLKLLLIILVVLAAVLVVLFLLGRRVQKRQAEQQEVIDQMAQTVSMLIIDKKKMKLKEASLPSQVVEQTPRYLRRSKVPIVKAKVGPKIMTMMCDQEIFEILPVKTEVKAVVSGLYITELKSVRGSVVPKVQKKRLTDRMRERVREQVNTRFRRKKEK